MLNKQTGNMYSWVTHTWNPIKGKCPHECSYCYMKRFPIGELRLDKKCFNDDLGEKNIIFVGSSCDMFAEDVPNFWIKLVLRHIGDYPDNTYLFQTKNPYRFNDWILPDNSIVGTTIESNRDYKTSKAPIPEKRYYGLLDSNCKRKMVSIEPILDFDVDVLTKWIIDLKPDFVSIGADSKNNGLPEPNPDKIKDFIHRIESITQIKLKDNLKRILPDYEVL